jgi:peptide/nickel transport system permease protein
MLGAFARNWQARIGVGAIAGLVLFCFAGPLLYRTSQVTVNLNLKDLAPGGSHPLGTDDTGYDVLGRLMLAGQSSLELGFAVAIATTILGTVYGAIAGIAGGIIDGIMMRVIDTLLAIPWLVLLLIMVNIFPPNLWTIIALLSVLSWLPGPWAPRPAGSWPGTWCRTR